MLDKLKQNHKITIVRGKRIKKPLNTSKKWDNKSIKRALKKIKTPEHTKVDTIVLDDSVLPSPHPAYENSYSTQNLGFENNEAVTSTPKSRTDISTSYIPNDSYAENIDPHFAANDDYNHNNDNENINMSTPLLSKTYERPQHRQPLQALPVIPQVRDEISIYFGFSDEENLYSEQISPKKVKITHFDNIKKPSKSNLHDQLRQLRHIEVSEKSNMMPVLATSTPAAKVENKKNVPKKNMKAVRRQEKKIEIEKKKKEEDSPKSVSFNLLLTVLFYNEFSFSELLQFN